jgi:hypothetical protein
VMSQKKVGAQLERDQRSGVLALVVFFDQATDVVEAATRLVRSCLRFARAISALVLTAALLCVIFSGLW